MDNQNLKMSLRRSLQFLQGLYFLFERLFFHFACLISFHRRLKLNGISSPQAKSQHQGTGLLSFIQYL
jgi:hypothetical protein